MSPLTTRPAGVEFRTVTRAYGPVKAVDSVSFTIAPGTLVTLLGPSGCGKTTTLRMIAGLEFPTDGQILIGGKDVTRLHATERDVTMVFQSYALFPHMSVIQNVSYGLTLGRLPKAEIEAKAKEGLRLVGLAGYENRLPSELSGGQQQRVAVARALVLEPEVLLFDEPLSNLDAKLRRKMRDDIRDLQQSLGLTSVYVTHDQEEALAVSDRVIVMNRSVIAQEGTPTDLYERPVNRFVADFIGGANLLNAELLARTDEEQGQVRLGDLSLTLPHRDLAPGGVTLAVRPHAIRVSAQPGPNSAPAEVKKATYLGSHIEYHLSSAFGDLFAVGGDLMQALPAGATAHISLAERGVTLLPGA
ncbi:ABC transporter ATP-binding protein [Elstera cyanobacteriorum]|uniref:ABC transporter ATP-binding protein n=1 Tax=Elstera cyanobacteriorum TaxID=2022747 RepID=A0A255XT76_9PROT|nr:ABC transporter ATP-binding protein [Elstera cyanobacteriorum]MCK6442518.1 ABC transporter ATP-binding protein [Elstera cyanobacteriorum]OYQ19460.1 ABC transporter ATP-binding protein [Elstera cyanobacteriorum]GFZ91609.1 ABC transporter ATP-binding protein [Elstera cyanobacteriorum]